MGTTPTDYARPQWNRRERDCRPDAVLSVSVLRMAKDWGPDVSRARAALVVAALRKSLLTYEELGAVIGVRGVDLRN